MDQKYFGVLRDTLVKEFVDPASLQDWVSVHVTGASVHNILTGATFDQRAFALLTWGQATSRLDEVLQLLADNPPNGSRTLPNIIYALSAGSIQPAVARRNGIPPIAPTKDWFVTRRPFANRKDLRRLLEALDQAGPGADSVLLIDGDRYSGKSHGIRFAIQCAPQDRFTAVDVVDFGDVVMNAADLARAIDDSRSADFPAFDPTKEDEAVPRLLVWLTGKLKGSRQWIIVDHCSHANLSRPALILLTKLAGVIERGVLPGVRLIVAEIDRAKLPAGANYDRAALPSEDAVGLWCETLGAHIGKPALTKTQISAYINSVFGSIAAGTAPNDHASLVEAGLAKVFGSLQEL